MWLETRCCVAGDGVAGDGVAGDKVLGGEPTHLDN